MFIIAIIKQATGKNCIFAKITEPNNIDAKTK